MLDAANSAHHTRKRYATEPIGGPDLLLGLLKLKCILG